MSARRYDVAVVGAGMAGGALAGLLARAGFSVAVVEASEPPAFDAEAPVGLRVSALSPGSSAVLEEAGAWRRIVDTRACPYRRMHVEDRGPDAAVEFDAPAFGFDTLGTIVENDLAQWVLWQTLSSSALVDVHCPERVETIDNGEAGVTLTLAGGGRLQADLAVAADGAASALRTAAGIDVDHWEYNQKAVVGVVRTARDNPGVAWQRFLDTGPLAFLPLADGASSIVWTLPAPVADEHLALDDDAFLERLDEAGGAWSGAAEAIGPRAAFPLSMRLAERYVAGRVVLLGDAAHVVHPLAGQGVNLGIADAAALVETLIAARRAGDGLADRARLAHWGRWRRSESEVIARGIHALREGFLPAALGPLRRLGLRAVSKSWLLREAFVLRATGRSPNAPRLCRGERLADLMRA